MKRAVLDTVVFVQALISGRGASAGCFERMRAGLFLVLTSDALMAEVREVPLRAELTRRYSQLSPAVVDAFVNDVIAHAIHVPTPAKVFTLPRDSDDEFLIDLAVAGTADFLVTWNSKHLTYLMSKDTPEGADFCSRFPNLRILSPTDFLSIIDSESP